MLDMKAIDVHGHFGTYDTGVGADALSTHMYSGDINEIRRRARAVNICLTVVSPYGAFSPYGGDVLAGNEDAREAAERYADIRFWAVLNPRIPETYKQVESLLQYPRCKGIKLHPHPDMNDYPISEYGDKIFCFAADHKAIILSHTGDVNCYPEEFIPFANRYPQATLILAHLGNSRNDASFSRQVHALKHARAANVYIDTSSGKSINSGLIEWAVSQAGAEHILFGTDTPIYLAASHKARIEYADIDQQAKRAILFDNAARLLGEEDTFDTEKGAINA